MSLIFWCASTVPLLRPGDRDGVVLDFAVGRRAGGVRRGRVGAEPEPGIGRAGESLGHGREGERHDPAAGPVGHRACARSLALSNTPSPL